VSSDAVAEGGASRRRVLVTGGTSGIGAAAVLRFAAAGADVTAAGLDPASAMTEVRSAADSVVELDVRRPEQVEAVLAGFSRLDVLVNAAGVVRRGEEYRLDAFEDVVDVNLTGTMRACVAAHPLLADSGGCVVNVASMLSFFGGPLVPGYSASKGAVVQLTKSLAVAWAADGIRVNAVAPGWIATSLTATLQNDPVAQQRVLSRTPMARWGTPEDVAGAVVFLCSADAGFITGVVLPVDGGYLCV
jgi:NAD(P)-dependent dehydrogenase (short-subunit alcohol dehydrogenase family)